MEYKTYHEQNDMENIRKLREVLKTLPSFAKDYFRAIEPTTSTKTRISYAYDIRVFFRFLIEENPVYKNCETTDFKLSDLDRVEAVDIEEYQEYLKLYQKKIAYSGTDKEKESFDTIDITNGERGLKRKMSALRSFYAYFYKRQLLEHNPTVFVDMPKLHDKAIIRLDVDETARLLDFIEHGGDG
ncbi:MAG: integrase, partial [Lachnospiraceae bacterium]|nr:integrase [Lachnospiraceae bacterium]